VCERVFTGNVHIVFSTSIASTISTLASAVHIVGNVELGHDALGNYLGSFVTEDQLLQLFGRIKSITGNLLLYNSSNLLTLEGFSNLTLISGSLTIEANTNLASLEGLRGLSRIYGFVGLSLLPKLVTVEGLRNVKSISG
jgi:hypothetical protein